ncbi:MAG: 2-amino-4-hydroxy-6-hydroxymethyldihydropteridine diphosphokinase [Solirubrobacteraceae bacterium]
MSRQGYLGLGSNIGERRANLQAAVAGLAAHGVRVLRSSSTYDTEPVGLVLEQPTFLNACLEVETAHEPVALLDACKEVEREVGRRTGSVRHGPRVIDVDVLLLGDLQYRCQRLTIPHPDLRTRRFVLAPLLELDAKLALPGGETLTGLLEALGPDGQAVSLAGPPLSVGAGGDG